MMCAWKELLSVLPLWMRADTDRLGRECLQEIRLRLDSRPELVRRNGIIWLDRCVGKEDISYCINAASRYSPWAAATSAKGYLTAPGGHRIGICGEAVCQGGVVSGIREANSLCIRVARDFPGIGNAAARMRGSILILGPPGWGKTTLLRDIAREVAETETVCVVDERGELFPSGFQKGKRMDVLTGCPKSSGIEMALRTMGPMCIAVDEITAYDDCHALMNAYGCGVRLLATAHGMCLSELRKRKEYRELLEMNLFQTVLLLQSDKSWRTERVEI